MSNQNKIEKNTQEISEILKVRKEKLNNLRESGQDPFSITSFAKSHCSTDVLSAFDALEGKSVRLAGRMMSKRVMGKASFSHIQDFEGKIQLYVRKDVLGDDPYAHYRKLDIGDIIGVEGDRKRVV